MISWAYHSYSRRTTGWVVADLVVALVVARPDRGREGAGYHSTVPGFWVMGAMFAWAIHWRVIGRPGRGRPAVGRPTS